MVKIQIASDLHLEFKENREWLENNPIMPKGDILLLAGDIVPDKYKKKARKFYDKISKDFKNVISAMGNHEFYHGVLSYAYPDYSSNLSENHMKLNNKSVVIDNVKFVVSTLWSNIIESEQLAIENGMNDFRIIFEKDFYGEKSPISVEKVKKLHKISFDFLKHEIEKPFDGKIVVMTHHLPSFSCVPKIYAKSNINSAYATNLDKFIKSHPQIKLWVCGHSHGFCDIKIGSTRIVRNTLGYVDEGQQLDFKRDFVIEI